MEKLGIGMLLYHGSYTEIQNIALSECIAGKDFGKGFYLTSSYGQAKNFVRLSVKRNRMLGKIDKKQNFGFVNVYEIADMQNTMLLSERLQMIEQQQPCRPIWME